MQFLIVFFVSIECCGINGMECFDTVTRWQRDKAWSCDVKDIALFKNVTLVHACIKFHSLNSPFSFYAMQWVSKGRSFDSHLEFVEYCHSAAIVFDFGVRKREYLFFLFLYTYIQLTLGKFVKKVVTNKTFKGREGYRVRGFSVQTLRLPLSTIIQEIVYWVYFNLTGLHESIPPRSGVEPATVVRYVLTWNLKQKCLFS